MPVPINPTAGITLKPCSIEGIARVLIDEPGHMYNLSWDRFVRLKRAAEATASTAPSTVLDVGGYDGALAFFLENCSLEKCSTDLLDPVTTGGTILQIPAANSSYDAVVAVDVLEHIAPEHRAKALSEIARVSKRSVILNYPCRESKEAQELILKLTNNPLIREHVEWELPDSDWVLQELARFGFGGKLIPHTSIAIWLGQYLTLNAAPSAAAEINRHLVANYADEPTTKPLYHLIVCERLA